MKLCLQNCFELCKSVVNSQSLASHFALSLDVTEFDIQTAGFHDRINCALIFYSTFHGIFLSRIGELLGRVDDFSFFDCSSPFYFLLIEFH